MIAVYASWEFARIQGMSWGWAAVIWVYSAITFFPLDVLKFIIRYALSGRAWGNLLDNKVRDRFLELKPQYIQALKPIRDR